MQRAALAQRHADHAALGGLGGLADRLRHLAGLAGAVADAALLVADDDEAAKAEATATLHHLGDAVDVTSLSTSSLSSLVAVARPIAIARGTAGTTG
jgi:predicted dinucleotide-binding enzyme